MCFCNHSAVTNHSVRKLYNDQESWLPVTQGSKPVWAPVEHETQWPNGCKTWGLLRHLTCGHHPFLLLHTFTLHSRERNRIQSRMSSLALRSLGLTNEIISGWRVVLPLRHSLSVGSQLSSEHDISSQVKVKCFLKIKSFVAGFRLAYVME